MILKLYFTFFCHFNSSYWTYFNLFLMTQSHHRAHELILVCHGWAMTSGPVELWAVLRKLLGKCLRVLDLLTSNYFSNSSLDVRPLLVTVLAVFLGRSLSSLSSFIQGLPLSICYVPGPLPQAKVIIQSRWPWARACPQGANLPVGEAKRSKVTIKQVLTWFGLREWIITLRRVIHKWGITRIREHCMLRIHFCLLLSNSRAMRLLASWPSENVKLLYFHKILSITSKMAQCH